jgi:hypothetical protein
MINELLKLSGVTDWKFFLQEGSIIGRCGLADRDIKIDLNGFNRLRTSQSVTTQILAYVSFGCLAPIHARIDEALLKPQRMCEVFNVHERKAFLIHFSSNWRSQIKELLNQVLSWGATLDPDTSVAMFAATRPDGPSVPQINHLVALAYLGDFTTLEGYARTFAKGLRLNFVPLITREAIEAALDASYDYSVQRRTIV